MHFNIITLFPELFDSYLNFSVFYKGLRDNIFKYRLYNLREYGIGRHRKVDEYPFGGGKGMVLRCEPFFDIFNEISETLSENTPEDVSINNKRLTSERGAAEILPDEGTLDTNGHKVPAAGKVIYLSPKGRVFNQSLAQEYAKEEKVTLICGRYEGIDQRIIDMYVDEEISIGDYVLTGSELPALVFIDAVCRNLEGFLEKEAVEEESFSNNLLEYPHYTRPFDFMGNKVPEVLISGHHEKIRQWRLSQSIGLTRKRRPDLYKKYLEEKNAHS